MGCCILEGLHEQVGHIQLLQLAEDLGLEKSIRSFKRRMPL